MGHIRRYEKQETPTKKLINIRSYSKRPKTAIALFVISGVNSYPGFCSSSGITVPSINKSVMSEWPRGYMERCSFKDHKSDQNKLELLPKLL